MQLKGEQAFQDSPDSDRMTSSSKTIRRRNARLVRLGINVTLTESSDKLQLSSLCKQRARQEISPLFVKQQFHC